MRRKSYFNKHSDYFSYAFKNVDFYLSEKPYSDHGDFWEHEDGNKKVRRFDVLRGCRNLHAIQVKSRFLMTNILPVRFSLFALKNKKYLSIFRKYVSNYSFYSLGVSNALRSSNLMLRKLIFYDFLTTKNCMYSWYNIFSKRVFFFKKNIYKQPCVPLKKGSDLFILGNLDVSPEEELSNLFVKRDYNSVFDFKELQSQFNLNLFFDISIQHTVEFYKITQLLYIHKLNKICF